MTTIYELTTVYDRCKSFYGKARIEIDGIKRKLYSYNVHILTEENGAITYITNNENHFTTTTNRHINEFLRQFTNEHGKSKKELLKMAGIEK